MTIGREIVSFSRNAMQILKCFIQRIITGKQSWYDA